MMQGLQTGGLILCVSALLLCAVPLRAAPNVVYYEPQLREEFGGQIHPYAWSHLMPDPHYTGQTAESPTHEFQTSFLSMQTHIVRPKDTELRRLTVTPALVETKATTTEGDKFIGAMAAGYGLMKLGKFLMKNKDDTFDMKPNQYKPSKTKPFNSAFKSDDHTEGGGVFGNHWRRGQYGLRRRRMPYFGLSSTLNPFRRPNSMHKTPHDMMFPRVRLLEAMNPHLTDFGQAGRGINKPYGGYSSFTQPKPANSWSMGTDGMPNFGGQAPRMGRMGVSGQNFNLGSFDSALTAAYPQAFMPDQSWRGPHPFGNGPSNFIPGSHQFQDVYGYSQLANPQAGAGAGAGAGAEGGEAAAAEGG